MLVIEFLSWFIIPKCVGENKSLNLVVPVLQRQFYIFSPKAIRKFSKIPSQIMTDDGKLTISQLHRWTINIVIIFFIFLSLHLLERHFQMLICWKFDNENYPHAILLCQHIVYFLPRQHSIEIEAKKEFCFCLFLKISIFDAFDAHNKDYLWHLNSRRIMDFKQ